jgi:hypothetical protein
MDSGGLFPKELLRTKFAKYWSGICGRAVCRAKISHCSSENIHGFVLGDCAAWMIFGS